MGLSGQANNTAVEEHGVWRLLVGGSGLVAGDGKMLVVASIPRRLLLT